MGGGRASRRMSLSYPHWHLLPAPACLPDPQLLGRRHAAGPREGGAAGAWALAPFPQGMRSQRYAATFPLPTHCPHLPPPHQLTRRGVREITADRRKQDDEERAAAEAAGPEALAEWMMTQARSEGGGAIGRRRQSG